MKKGKDDYIETKGKIQNKTHKTHILLCISTHSEDCTIAVKFLYIVGETVLGYFD